MSTVPRWCITASNLIYCIKFIKRLLHFRQRKVASLCYKVHLEKLIVTIIIDFSVIIFLHCISPKYHTNDTISYCWHDGKNAFQSSFVSLVYCWMDKWLLKAFRIIYRVLLYVCDDFWYLRFNVWPWSILYYLLSWPSI